MQRRIVWLCGYDGNAIIEWCDVNPATPILQSATTPNDDRGDDDSDDNSNNDVNDVH